MKSLTASFSFISLAILFVIACSAALAHAQEASATTTPTEQVTPPTKTPAEIQEPRTTARVVLDAVAQKRVTNLAANISNRLDAYVNRLSQISDRLDIRIDLVARRGVITTEAASHLQRATQELDSARTLLTTIDTVAANVVGSENPREAWQEAKNTYHTIKTHIVTAHQALQEAVNALKRAIETHENPPAAPENTDTATTTN